MNQMMQGGNCGNGNEGRGITNVDGTSAPPPNSSTAPVHKQQEGRGQAGLYALKAAVALVGEAETSHKLSKRMLKGQSNVGGDDSRERDFRAQALESQNL